MVYTKRTTPFPRHRVQNDLKNVTISEEGRQTSCAAPNWAPTGYTKSMGFGTYMYMDDWVVPGYRARSGRGEVFFNPLSKHVDQYSDGSGTSYNVTSVANTCSAPAFKAEYRLIGNPAIMFSRAGSVGGFLVPEILPALDDAVHIEPLRRELSTRVFSERGRSESNLWETLAEFDQSVGMLHRPLGRLHDFLNKVEQASGLRRKAGLAVTGLSTLWLAYRYGLRPIVNDIANISLGLKKPSDHRRQTTRSSGSVSNSKTYSYTAQFGVISCVMQVVSTGTAKLRAMALDDFEASQAYNLGFTPKGIITLPWELIPYSFVADWFLNLGDYIGALIPAVGWNLLGSQLSQTTQTVSVTTIQSATCTSGSYTMPVAPSGALIGVRTSKTRYPLSQPGLTIRNDFRFDNVERVVDSLTLASQRMGGIFR